MKSNFKVGAFDPKPLSWWKSRRKKIDMEPPYQRRGRLWSATDKGYLIDSILNEFDIPKIYMADFTWRDSQLNISKLPYAIIDGKQRFEAIFDFFDGEVTLNDDFVYLEDPSLRLGGLGYKDLQNNYSHIAEAFETYTLTVMSVITDSEELINDLFVRLNRSKPLTGAEIRNAMSGPAPGVIRQVARHTFFKSNIRFATTRGQDLNAAAKVLMFEFYDEPSETKKTNLNQFVEESARGRGILELAARRAVEILSDMESIFLPKDKLFSSAGIFPVYYWLVRSAAYTSYYQIREFLVKFEEQRRQNREIIANNPQSNEVDHQLVEFDNYNRSTNDARSHVGRYDILRERFERHLLLYGNDDEDE